MTDEPKRELPDDLTDMVRLALQRMGGAHELLAHAAEQGGSGEAALGCLADAFAFAMVAHGKREPIQWRPELRAFEERMRACMAALVGLEKAKLAKIIVAAGPTDEVAEARGNDAAKAWAREAWATWGKAPVTDQVFSTRGKDSKNGG